MGRSLPGRLGMPALVVAAAVALSSLVAVAPAFADTAPADPTSPRTPTTVSADALPAPQVDGVVYQQIIVGNTVYVAGKFTSARPAGSPAGTNEVPRSSVLAYDVVTGALSTTFAPTIGGQVKALAASPDGKRIYLGGSFTSVNGTTKYRLAAVDPKSGALVANWGPSTNASVNSIVAVGNVVYFGGIFTTVGSQTRAKAAAVQASNGATLPWAPRAEGGDVLSVVANPEGSKIVLGGSFTSVNGSSQPGYGLAMIDPVTGANLPFAANDTVRNGGTTTQGGAAIYSLTATKDGIFGSGYDYYGVGNLEGAFKATWDGDLTWVEDCHGDTYSVAANSSAVYIAGHPHYCGNVGGHPQTEPWTFQHAMAFSQEATQTVAHNTQETQKYFDFGGTPAPSILHWAPEFTIGTVTKMDQAVWSVAANDQYVVYGGEFPSVNGKKQATLTRFAVKDLAPNTEGPRASGALFALDAASFAPGSARVLWPANWDRDNAELSYEVYRDGNLKAPVYTTKASSTWWNRPTLGFVDAGLEPGSAHSYRVRATDPLGNTAISDSVPVTVASAVDPYVATVTANGASAFWRLGEATGTRVRDWVGTDDMIAQPGVVRGASGQTAGDGASTFSGDDKGTSLAAAQVPGAAPDSFSVGAWFRTTTTAGGKIVGFGDKTTGRSNNYDRHVYMDESGRVNFGVWTGQESTLTSPTALNDGQWHQVVASLSPEGMQLFVDGKRVGQRGDVTRGQDYRGTWRVGGDNSWRGAAFFAGDIDDVAVYPKALTRGQVDADWVASGRPSALPTAPADAYGAKVFADEPIVWFRLDGDRDHLGTDSSPEATEGVVSGGVTAGAPSALSGGVGTSATFDGASGGVASGTRTQSLDTYSIETWFRTTTTAGGKLIGFGSSQTGSSGNYDRHIYLEPDGRLQFGTWSGQMNLATSAKSYNDGTWHHVVGTQGQDGMRLFVDGEVVGTNDSNRSDGYTGHWRIGGDSSWSGSNYVAADLDEAAVYSAQLSAATVKAHHDLGVAAAVPDDPTPNTAPTAAFTSTVVDLSASFDASGSSDADGTVTSVAWDFGDGTTGAGATADHAYGRAGTYRVTATVTDDAGATGTVTHDVTVTAPRVNAPPTASFTTAVDGLGVAVDGSGSADPDGTVTSWAWSFGDGGTGTGAKATHAYAAAGSYTVTLTVTDAEGATASTTRDVTATVPTPPAPAALVSDSFTRDTTGGWGSADVGGAWTRTGAATQYTVAGGAGRQQLGGPGLATGMSLGAKAADVDLRTSVALDQLATGGGTYAYVTGRKVAANSEYRASVRFRSDGRAAVSLNALRGSSTAVTIGADTLVPGAVTAGTKVNVRLQVTGTGTTTVRVKTWVDGTPEPERWTITATDSTAALQAPGTVGLGAYVSASAATARQVVSFDDLVVTAP
jgi:PKD repeat protein